MTPAARQLAGGGHPSGAPAPEDIQVRRVHVVVLPGAVSYAIDLQASGGVLERLAAELGGVVLQGRLHVLVARHLALLTGQSCMFECPLDLFPCELAQKVGGERVRACMGVAAEFFVRAARLPADVGELANHQYACVGAVRAMLLCAAGITQSSGSGWEGRVLSVTRVIYSV